MANCRTSCFLGRFKDVAALIQNIHIPFRASAALKRQAEL
jgi:hypothetical protein